MDLTVGPNFFFWPAEAVRGFYSMLADAPVSRVVLGELVCSKRLPFWQGEIPGAVETLLAAGKTVAITSLALITLKRERKLTAELADLGLPIEINDLSALAQVPDGQFCRRAANNKCRCSTSSLTARRSGKVARN